jgi:hypothetical protein
VGTPGERVVESVEQESVVAMRARYTTHPCTQRPDNFFKVRYIPGGQYRRSVKSKHISEQNFDKKKHFFLIFQL